MLLFVLFPATAPPVRLVYAASALVLTISLVCNFGYVLNELYDVEEDRRVGRLNAAATSSTEWLWCIACTCVGGALGLATWTTGVPGGVATLGALMFPILYSVPPIRLKERRALGVIADAAAAHVFPAMLCLLLTLRFASLPYMGIGWVVFAWSFAFGLRGILTHQLVDEERDRVSGLQTIVHQYGRDAIIKWILNLLVPLELGGLILICILSRPGYVLLSTITLYVVYESLKLLAGWKIVLFQREERPYLPFLNGGFYEVWGPLGAAAQVAATNPVFWPLPAIVIFVFQRRMAVERRMISALASDLTKKFRHH